MNISGENLWTTMQVKLNEEDRQEELGRRTTDFSASSREVFAKSVGSPHSH